MKRSVKMIALLMVLVLLVGGTVLVQKLNAPKSVSETEGSFPLTAKTAEELTGMQWTHEEVSYHFTKKDGAWKKADDASFPANTDAIQAMADELAGLTATRKLEDVTEPANYGLAEPAFTITAEWADGTLTTYAMGAELPLGDGYYLSLSTETGTAYAVEDALDDLFAKSGTELASLEDIPAVEEASRLTIGSALDASRAEESAGIDPEQRWYTADGKALDNDKLDDLADDAAAISWAQLISTGASEEELSTWNLTEDKATVITLSGADSTRTVLLGAADESGNYYARLPESSMVYTVTSASVSGLLGAQADSLRATDLMPLPFENVQKAELTAGGSTVSFTGVPAQEEAPADTEAADESAAETMEEEPETPEEALWKLVMALKADSFVPDAPGGEALLTIAVESAAGAAETLAFYEYDAESYLVVTGSGESALTDAAKVDQIIRTFRQFV